MVQGILTDLGIWWWSSHLREGVIQAYPESGGSGVGYSVPVALKPVFLLQCCIPAVWPWLNTYPFPSSKILQLCLEGTYYLTGYNGKTQ